jgi:lipopolysaccharide/colanic/teichoic acid biosynthesis glycosyltransferase
MSPVADGVRRALDVAVSGTLLLAAAPVLGVLALAVRATSPGPAFFRQERVGRDGRPFRLLKLRTMVADAAARGGALTAPGDARVTRLGTVLRRWKLYELPQFLNVLRDDMSLVGPRPEVPRYVAGYTPRQRASCACGRVSPIRRRSPTSTKAAGALRRLRARVRRNRCRRSSRSSDYLDRRTLRSDLGILVRTLVRVARGSGFGRRPRRAPVGGPDAALDRGP